MRHNHLEKCKLQDIRNQKEKIRRKIAFQLRQTICEQNRSEAFCSCNINLEPITSAYDKILKKIQIQEDSGNVTVYEK